MSELALAPSPTVLPANLNNRGRALNVNTLQNIATPPHLSKQSPTNPSPFTDVPMPVPTRTARAESRPLPNQDLSGQRTLPITAPDVVRRTSVNGKPIQFSSNIFSDDDSQQTDAPTFGKFTSGLMPPMDDEGGRLNEINLGRRTSVSAESLMPHAGPSGPKTTYAKSQDKRDRIEASIANNFLFKDLDEDQHNDVINAMEEFPVNAQSKVIEQGDVGDYFYVVEEGELDVFVKTPDSQAENNGLGRKVVSYTAGASFGELALMYNSPRAATVITTTNCVLWRLDRVTFRSILLESTSKKRRLYEALFASVPILTVLKPQERAKVADALESRLFEPGQAIIEQGEPGHEFFIIESGHAEVVKDGAVVGYLGRGDYFGELALLNSAPRAATVRACVKPSQGMDDSIDPQATPTMAFPDNTTSTDTQAFTVLQDTSAANGGVNGRNKQLGKTRIAALQKNAFTRLLGPVHEIMKRHGNAYNQEAIEPY